MNLHVDVQIQLNTTNDRQYLLDRIRDPALGPDAHVVYVYSLVGGSVNYPNKAGYVVYIGEAGRASEPTGKRFAQHICTGPDEGGDCGTIYALSRYYWLGRPMRLRIFLIPDKQQGRQMERLLLNAHVKEFGALPICQGTTGGNYTASSLVALALTVDQITIFGLVPTDTN